MPAIRESFQKDCCAEAFVEPFAPVSEPVFVEVFVVLPAGFVDPYFARPPQPAPTSAAATIPASRQVKPA